MLKNKIKSRFFYPTTWSMEQLQTEIKAIKENSDILVICPTPTGYSWLGIQIATLSLFPNCTLQLPQTYSNQELTNSQICRLSQCINDLGFKQVILSGYLPYFEKIVYGINKNIKVKVIYHGFLSELSGNTKQNQALMSLLSLVSMNRISKIGCVKKGLADSISALYVIPTCEIILPNLKIAKQIKPMQASINIGALVNTSFRKNIHNQAMAALLVKKAHLHVFKTEELTYLPQERITYHDLVSHDEFLSLLSDMTINLHVTFSESWGQVLSESISQGVPCISAYTSSFFDYNEYLKQKLVVDSFDDSWHIYKKIEEVLRERDEIACECIKYATYMNELSQNCLNIFLND